MKNIEIEFDEVESMSKEEAVSLVTKHFKGNKKFIEQARVLIYSTHDFIKINKICIQTDNWNWEKFLSVSIDASMGFKSLYYRKGNNKYAPENVSDELGGNTTHAVHEYKVVIYNKSSHTSEEYPIPV